MSIPMLGTRNCMKACTKRPGIQKICGKPARQQFRPCTASGSKVRTTIMTGILSAKKLLCLCSVLLMLLASSAWAAPAGQAVSPRQQAFIEQTRAVREDLKKTPDDPNLKKDLATHLYFLALYTPGNKEATALLREACGISLKLAPTLDADVQLQQTEAGGMLQVAANAGRDLLNRDRSDQENYRIAQSVLRMLQPLAAKPASEFTRARGILAANLAQAAKAPEQRTALFAAAQKDLRGYFASGGQYTEDAKRMLATTLTWEAGYSNDDAVKKARYAEAEALLATMVPQRKGEEVGIAISKALLWQFQARDAKDAKAREALLAKAEQLAQDGLDADPQNGGRQLHYYNIQAANAALKGDAAASLALTKKAVDAQPMMQEQHERYVWTNPLYDKVRNDPAFERYMESLRGGNSTPKAP